MMGRSHDEVMIEYFRANPDYAASLVNDILEDGDDQGELKVILQHIAAAGLNISPVSVTPKPTPRKHAKVSKAKPTPRKHAKAATTKAAKHRSVTAKAVKRLPGRGRARHSAAVHA